MHLLELFSFCTLLDVLAGRSSSDGDAFLDEGVEAGRAHTNLDVLV